MALHCADPADGRADGATPARTCEPSCPQQACAGRDRGAPYWPRAALPPLRSGPAGSQRLCLPELFCRNRCCWFLSRPTEAGAGRAGGRYGPRCTLRCGLVFAPRPHLESHSLGPARRPRRLRRLDHHRRAPLHVGGRDRGAPRLGPRAYHRDLRSQHGTRGRHLFRRPAWPAQPRACSGPALSDQEDRGGGCAPSRRPAMS